MCRRSSGSSDVPWPLRACGRRRPLVGESHFSGLHESLLSIEKVSYARTEARGGGRKLCPTAASERLRLFSFWPLHNTRNELPLCCSQPKATEARNR
jgi:hypothetical protein